MVQHGTAYGRVASVYDAMAALWSFGAIGRSKLAVLDRIAPGDRVLFAGGGTGADAVAVAGREARVTTIDVSEAMTRRARARATRAESSADVRAERPDDFAFEARTGDVREHRPDRPYDVVCAPYLLSAFTPREADDLLAHLASITRDGGVLFVAEFAPPGREAGPWLAGVRRLHYAVVAAAFRVLVGNPLRPIPDAVDAVVRAGLRVEERRAFGPFFEAVIARKPTPDEGPTPGRSSPRRSPRS